MTHWQRFQRLYVAILIFTSANALAAVAVFTVLTPLELQQLSGRAFALDLVKCIALATGSLLTYVIPTKPNPVP